MLNELTVALAATVGPILVLAPIVYALRPQGGRHTGVLVPDWLGPYDLRVRQAIAHYAAKKRQEMAAPAPHQAADRDLTGALPLVAVA